MDYLKKNLNQAVITLGGKGSRLKKVTNDIPKPLWKIEGHNTLERSIKVLSEQGINKFIWIVRIMNNRICFYSVK